MLCGTLHSGDIATVAAAPTEQAGHQISSRLLVFRDEPGDLVALLLWRLGNLIAELPIFSVVVNERENALISKNLLDLSDKHRVIS